MNASENVDVVAAGLAVIRRHVQAPDENGPGLDAVLRDLGVDSMAAIDLLLDLEETFAVTFPDTLLTEETFRTPATIIAAIASLRTDAASSNEAPAPSAATMGPDARPCADLERAG